MNRTNVQRVDESIEYIRNNVSTHLASQLTGINKEVAGKQISLDGAHYLPIGYATQHKAVRALLLCQYHFLGQWALPAQAKTFFKSKSEKDVKKYISAFAKDTPMLEKLAAKAETYQLEQGLLGWNKRCRADNNIGGSAIICYSGVLLWLFQSGFVSLQWYMDNNNMNANNCNDILGAGDSWLVKDMEQIPRGWIWNFQGFRKEVCHWGISLGNGRAAGTNNTEKANAADGKEIRVAFEPGGGLAYGKFTLRSQYNVLRRKYDSTSVRDTSPGAMATDFLNITGVETKLFVINPTMKTFG